MLADRVDNGGKAGGSDPLSEWRDHNQRVVGRLHHYVETIDLETSEWNLDTLRAFLREEVIPHMHAEELDLSPVLDSILRVHGRPTAAMGIEHEFISRTIHMIEDETLTFEMEHDIEKRHSIRQKIGRLLAVLEAVVGLQLDKEDLAYAPLLSEHLPAKQIQKTVDDMRRRERTGALAV